jgi:hypothetical protein
VQLHNSGKHPFSLKSTGFKLSGRRGPLHGNLRCPRNVIDPGSMLQVGAFTCSAVTCCDSCCDMPICSLQARVMYQNALSACGQTPSSFDTPSTVLAQMRCAAHPMQQPPAYSTAFNNSDNPAWFSACTAQPHLYPINCTASQCGFIANAPEPLAFTSLQPFIVPQTGSSPCYCQQPFAVKPFQGSAGGAASSSSQAEAITNHGVAKSLAEAMSQAFGGKYCCCCCCY